MSTRAPLTEWAPPHLWAASYAALCALEERSWRTATRPEHSKATSTPPTEKQLSLDL